MWSKLQATAFVLVLMAAPCVLSKKFELPLTRKNPAATVKAFADKPLTFCSARRSLNGPFASRWSTNFAAVAGPMPPTRCGGAHISRKVLQIEAAMIMALNNGSHNGKKRT